MSLLHVGIRRVRNDHPDFKEFAYKSVLKKMLSHAATDQEFTHNFKVTYYTITIVPVLDMFLCNIPLLYQLSSAYSGNIMPYTNYTFDFKVTKKHDQQQSKFLVVCCRVL